MKAITLHVTDLDSFLWYNTIESMSADELVGRLKRTSPPNESMLAGTAWHDVLENPPDEITEIERNGFKFIIECDAEITIPQIREIRANKHYLIDGIDVVLTGGCDGVTGNKISDHKLTFNPKPENYLDSYQWRSYLDIYNAGVFQYNIYHGVKKPDAIYIKNVSSMQFYRYPKMIEYVENGIRELVGFIETHAPEMILQ